MQQQFTNEPQVLRSPIKLWLVSYNTVVYFSDIIHSQFAGNIILDSLLCSENKNNFININIK